jgi:hypothetical protein
MSIASHNALQAIASRFHRKVHGTLPADIFGFNHQELT